MKQPRRWAAWLAAILIAASLVAMPREGAVAGPFLDGNPPINEGEPDGPPNGPAYVIREPRPWRLSLAFVQGHLYIIFGPARPRTQTYIHSGQGY